MLQYLIAGVKDSASPTLYEISGIQYQLERVSIMWQYCDHRITDKHL